MPLAWAASYRCTSPNHFQYFFRNYSADSAPKVRYFRNRINPSVELLKHRTLGAQYVLLNSYLFSYIFKSCVTGESSGMNHVGAQGSTGRSPGLHRLDVYLFDRLSNWSKEMLPMKNHRASLPATTDQNLNKLSSRPPKGPFPEATFFTPLDFFD